MNRKSALAARASRRARTTPDIPNWLSCTVLTTDGVPCDRDTSSNLSVCDIHAMQVYRWVVDRMAEHTLRVPEVVNAVATLDGRGGRSDCAAPTRPDVMNGWPEVVYYARIGEHIKIGTTRNLFRRIRWYPPCTRLLAVEPGGAQVERERHHQFKHRKVARDEWFEAGPDLMEHVRALADAGLPPAS